MSAERLARIHTALQRYVDREEIAGAVSLVARHGRVVYQDTAGMMDREAGKPMKPDAMFRIASMTKPITSLAAMMLFEEGYFQLSDPVSKFIPEMKHMMVSAPTWPGGVGSANKVPAEREITIRHLLTHTAGLPGLSAEAYLKLERHPDENMGDLVKRLVKLPLNFQPGTALEYGPATDVLGYLVEVISGMPLDRYFAERIFRPLGMTDTYFYVPEDKLPRLAANYMPDQPKGIKLAPTPARTARKLFSGAGGLVSTAGDYVRFCQLMLNGGTLNGTRLLSRKTVELMTQNHIGNLPMWKNLAGYRFGLGYRVLTDLGESANLGSLGSYGWGGAFGTYFWIDPKEDTIGILMVQIRPYDHLNIRQDFETLATQAIVD